MIKRKIFETESDKIRQEKTAKILEKYWKCKLIPTASLTPYDYLVYKEGKLKAIVEIKWRLNRKASDFGGITFLNLHKKLDLIKEADKLKCEPIFVWQFTDEIRAINLRINFPIERRGREDRDGLDIREVLRIPVCRTKLVNVKYETN